MNGKTHTTDAYGLLAYVPDDIVIDSLLPEISSGQREALVYTGNAHWVRVLRRYYETHDTALHVPSKLFRTLAHENFSPMSVHVLSAMWCADAMPTFNPSRLRRVVVEPGRSLHSEQMLPQMTWLLSHASEVNIDTLWMSALPPRCDNIRSLYLRSNIMSEPSCAIADRSLPSLHTLKLDTRCSDLGLDSVASTLRRLELRITKNAKVPPVKVRVFMLLLWSLFFLTCRVR